MDLMAATASAQLIPAGNVGEGPALPFYSCFNYIRERRHGRIKPRRQQDAGFAAGAFRFLFPADVHGSVTTLRRRNGVHKHKREIKATRTTGLTRPVVVNAQLFGLPTAFRLEGTLLPHELAGCLGH